MGRPEQPSLPGPAPPSLLVRPTPLRGRTTKGFVCSLVLSHPSELEASKPGHRTKAGLERVKAQGKTPGRPDGFTLHGPVLARMKAEGFSQGRMSRETGLAINTIKGYLRRLEGQRDA